MFGLNKIIPVNSDYKFLNYRKNFYIASGIAIFLSLILESTMKLYLKLKKF